MPYKNEYTAEDAKSAVGPGWAKLIDEIYTVLPDDVAILQVKEKWGQLCFYVGSCQEEVLNFISQKERESLTTCEECGNPGVPRKGGWIITLCDAHANGREAC